MPSFLIVKISFIVTISSFQIILKAIFHSFIPFKVSISPAEVHEYSKGRLTELKITDPQMMKSIEGWKTYVDEEQTVPYVHENDVYSDVEPDDMEIDPESTTDPADSELTYVLSKMII